MRAIFSERLRSSYENAPPHIQRAFDRRIALLLKILTSRVLYAYSGVRQARNEEVGAYNRLLVTARKLVEPEPGR